MLVLGLALGSVGLAAGAVGVWMWLDEPAFRLAGAFSANVTQADLEAFGGRMRALGGDAAILESHPPQFVVDGLSREACEEARAFAASRAYVARVGECAG